VEGNSKNVDVILTRLKKKDDEDSELSPFVVKQEHVLSKDNEPTEVIFTGLDSNTLYGIRMRGTGKGGVGNEYVHTQATLSITPDPLPDKPEDITQEPVQTANEAIKDQDLNPLQGDVKASEPSNNYGEIPTIVVETHTKEEETLADSDVLANEVEKTEDTSEEKETTQEDKPQVDESKPPTPPAETVEANENLEKVSASPPEETKETPPPETEVLEHSEPNSASPVEEVAKDANGTEQS